MPSVNDDKSVVTPPRKPKRKYRFYKDIIVHGIKYEDVASVAREYNVTERLVRHHLSKGTPDRIGIGSGFTKDHSLNVNGVYYSSMNALRRALNRSYHIVKRHIDNGTIDEYARTNDPSICLKTVPVRWRNLDFDSIKECAIQLGRTYTTISYHLNKGTLDQVEPTANSPVWDKLRKEEHVAISK